MRGIQREGLDYEFTLVFDGTILNKPEFIPSIDTGKQILAWCEQGIGSWIDDTIEEIKKEDRVL